MSEYWKSTPKYWCKHCKTFVVDTKLSRTQHDSTAKHQSALARFLRDLHRSNERDKAEKGAAKKEVERLNALTSGKPFSSSGRVGGTGATTKWASTGTRQPSEAEKTAQMKQLESLGVTLPEEFRKEVALPGEWLETSTPPSTLDTTTTSSTRGKLSLKLNPDSKDSKEAIEEELRLKRKAEEARRWEDMDEDERAMKKFKVETKSYPGDTFGGDYDDELDALLRTVKRKVVKKEDDLGKAVRKEEEVVAEDGGVVRREEENVDNTPAVVKQEGVEKKLGDGIAFKKRKVGNLRKK